MVNEIAERKKRWQRFYDRAAPPSHMLLVRLAEPAEAPRRPLANPDRRDERVEWAWRRYLAHRERAAWLHDDSIPYLSVYTGTELFAEAFGCPVHRPDDNSPFALPRVYGAAEASRLRVPDLDVPCLRMVFSIADELRARGGPDAVLHMADIQSPMDIAALIWEKADFFVAMIESPEAVRELATKVESLLTAFLDEWFRRYGRDFVAHFPDYYMPDGVTLSEDEIGAVGPDAFDAFFAAELASLSARYGGIGIHCCAKARHQWSRLAAVPGLRLLNICQPPDVVRQAYAFFAPYAAQMHGNGGSIDLEAWVRALPAGSRVVVEAPAATRAEAEKLVERLRPLCRDRGEPPLHEELS